MMIRRFRGLLLICLLSSVGFLPLLNRVPVAVAQEPTPGYPNPASLVTTIDDNAAPPSLQAEQPGTADADLALATQPQTIGSFGMNTYFTGYERIGKDGDGGIQSLVTLGREAGVEWSREEFSWANIQRNRRESYDWSVFDNRVLQSAQAGYGIVGMLLTTPAWARVGDCSSRASAAKTQTYWCPPANPYDFAAFAAAAVERYDGDGFNDAPGSPRVAVWEIWNEPSARETWPGSPAEYAAILVTSYQAIKTADPNAMVVTGGIYVFDGFGSDATDGIPFFDRMLAANPQSWYAFDAFAIHPFMPTVAPDEPGLIERVTLWGRIATARNWLLTRSQQRRTGMRPIWITEVGWSTCKTSSSDCPAAVAKSEGQQASYLVRTYITALALGIQHISWFQLEDKFDGSARNFWEEASILGTKSQGYRQKPAFAAYRTLTAQLAGMSYLGTGQYNAFPYQPDVLMPVTTFHFRFGRPDGVVVDVLWRNSGTQTVSLPVNDGRTISIVGTTGATSQLNVSRGRVSFTISDNPIFIRQDAPPIPPRLEIAQVMLPNAVTVVSMPEPGRPFFPMSTTIANVGGGSLNWTASSAQSWVHIRDDDGAAPGTLYWDLDLGALPNGYHVATISVQSNGGTQQFNIAVISSSLATRRYIPLTMR